MTLASFSIDHLAAVLFALALVHTFAAKQVGQLARVFPRHAGLWHLLGEVEVVFGLWAMLLLLLMAWSDGANAAIHYAESRNYTEPLFVFVVMVMAAARPVLELVDGLLRLLARMVPLSPPLASVWLGLAVVPLMGSLITEPAAMTLAALMLAPLVFRSAVPEKIKYFALGVLFVNVSIGGTLTTYAAPAVLMVAGAWGWDSGFLFASLGWKAILAVLLNASLATGLLRRHVLWPDAKASADQVRAPWTVKALHVLMLTAVILSAHHPVIFLGFFLLFLGLTQAYVRYQNPLILREGLLVGFFLAGLVVLGGLQQWWLQPLITRLEPLALFMGAMALTAITDNAALTYLGSLVDGISSQSQYMLVAGAVAGGGLTVIANAPNPAGAALLRRGFRGGSIQVGGLLLGAALPTAVAALAFLLL